MKHLAFAFCLLFSMSASASDFAFSNQWLKLVHYQKSLFGNYEGSINNNHFYLADDGRLNPKTEMEATIKLFEGKDQKQKCQFPARYMVLKKHGLINSPLGKCEEYEQFQQDLKPAGITLLFTDAFMNNSSSLFGHTLFRIDTARKGTQLLAHGVNYGAFTKGFEDTPLYPIYGLLGFFQGGLTTRPYYETINTYNNIENRDIWEYQLDFSPDEQALFVAHIWEIGHVTTPYYFFSKNCSYMLLEILDAVKPNLNLAAEFTGYVIPLDTVKAVSKKGLIKQTNYRPSRRNKIKHRINQMNKKQYRAFLALIKDENTDISSLGEHLRSDVLETAYQYIQYQYTAQKLDLKTYRKKSFALLRQRNKNKKGQTFNALKDGQNPVFAHDSSQIALFFGTQNGSSFQEIRFRPAYHDLTDNPFGYLSGAAINFLETRLRHYDNQNKYVLEKLKVLELASLSPVDRTFKALSYRINLDLSRIKNLNTKKDGYVLNAEIAFGLTSELFKNFYTYGLTSLDTAYGGFLRQNATAGFGLTGGILYNAHKISLQAELKKIFATQKSMGIFSQKALAAYHLSTNTSLELSFERKTFRAKSINETMLGIKYFF